MIRKIYLGLLIPLVVFFFPSREDNHYEIQDFAGFTSCGVTNSTFDAGEEITLELAYKWGVINMNAGEVVFKVEDMGDTYRFSAFGRTYAGYEWFYKVRDYYETIVDKKSLLPISAKKRLAEGKYRLYERVEFDHNKGTATAYRGKTPDNLKPETVPIEQCMYDIMSILYMSRNIDYSQLKVGEAFPTRFFMDKKIYPIDVIYNGKDSKKRIKHNGLHKTIHFKPQLLKNKIFPDGGEMDIWISDDENKIPMLIESPVSLGKVRAILKDYKGLKYPIGSSLK